MGSPPPNHPPGPPGPPLAESRRDGRPDDGRYRDLLRRLEATRAAGVLLGLDRTRAVLARLGDPQRRFVTIQIAGTNGKGSTAAMTEAMLRAGGIRTGLFTSPHLSRFTERIRIDGREADGARLAELADGIFATGVPLTYFEVATVLAFLQFADAGVEVAVLETGLGGRLDATTVCEPVATAITSIGLDHVEVLGATLGEIAGEKAGIAKRGVPLFLAPVAADADAVIAAAAARVGAPLRRFGPDFSSPPSPPALEGAHQATNAALAVALAQAAAAALKRPLSPAAIVGGLAAVVWPGRLEWVDHVLLDCAHNAEGAQALRRALDGLSPRRRALVVSVVAGKNAAAMLATLASGFEAIYPTRSSSDRSLAPEALARLVPPDVAAEVIPTEDPLAALAAARQRVGRGDDEHGGLVVGAGSIFLVGDLRAALLGEARDPILTSDPPAGPVPIPG